MLHNQLLYSFYSGGKLTIRMIHVHIVVKSDTQVRYVTNSPFSFSPKLWHKHSYRQIPRSFLSSHFPSPYHLAPLLFPLLRSNPILYFTRTTHAHDASHRAAPTRMCALCMWVGHGMTTVESNMKREHNLYLPCEDSPQSISFSCSRLALLAPTVPWLHCFLFCNAATVSCVQYSTPKNAYVAEDQPRCSTSIVKKRCSSLSSFVRPRLAIRYSPAHVT